MSAGIAWRRRWPEARDAIGGGAQVWIGRATDVPAAVGLLEPTAADAAEALCRPATLRAAFLRRRLLLRQFVAALTGCPAAAVCVVTEQGRPRLGPPLEALSVSMAGREDWLALALAGSPLGVDLEPVGGAQEPAWNVLSPGEQARLRALPAADRWPAFLALWTAKEAYLKAIGLGLSREPRTIEVTVRDAALLILDAGRPAGTAVAEGMTLAVPGGVVRAACVTLRPPP